MYCVKVDVGRERARVRDYHSGFLPSYKPAFLYRPGFSGSRGTVPNDRGAKHLVVPGFIFMLQKDPRSQRVDDQEWKVIDAISDTRPSVLDPESGKIVDGPLEALNHLITRVDGDRVQFSARLLDADRQYWVQVNLVSDAPDSPEEAKKETKETDREEQTMDQKQKPEYSQEQKEAMLARAEKVGIRAAAAEYGVAWQTLSWMQRNARKAANPPAEKKKAGRKARPKSAPSEAASTQTAAPDDQPKSAAELMMENALLNEKIRKLEAKVKKLQKALSDLIED